MASLKPTTNLGGSVSSLIRSAGSLATAIAANQDEEARIIWENSGYTDAALDTYKSYLTKRINTLNSTGRIADNTKALSLSQDIVTATRANVHATITRENIQLLAGNASTTDKLNTVISQAMRAQSIGDDTLYQQLESQAYTLSQQVQKEQSDAAVANQTLYNVNSALSQIPGYGGAPKLSGGSANQDWVQQITAAAKKYGVDPNAALAVASAEGLSGGVGDNGTSFGPFQLHVGGALPAGKDRAWAESPAGIDYALKTIAGVAKGLTGQAAVEAIVTKFERPANPTGEVARAMSVYGSPGKLTTGQSALASGSATPSDIASNAVDYANSIADAENKGAELMKSQVKDLNQAIQKIGVNGTNKLLDQWVKDHADAFKQMGVDLPKGAKPNYGSVLEGAYKALNKYYSFAALAASGAGDQSAVDKYTNLANSYATGDATLPVLGKNGKTMNMGLADLQDLAVSLANPGSTARYMQASDGSIIEKPQAGFAYDPVKGVVPAYLSNPYEDVAGHPEQSTVQVKEKNGKTETVPAYQAAHPYAYVSAPLDLTTTLNKLGLQFTASSRGYAHQGQEVEVTDKSADFIKKIVKPGTPIEVYMSPQGLQFKASSTGGKTGNAVYTVVRDGTGKSALYENGPDGNKLLGGEYGFNWNNPDGRNNSNESQGFIGHLLSIASNNVFFANMFGRGNPNIMISNAATRAYAVQQEKIAEQNRIAAQAMLSAPPPPLPNISVNSAPPQVKALQIYNPPALQPISYNPAPQPVAPKTYNPQPASSIPLQGGSFQLQGGGGGIRLQ